MVVPFEFVYLIPFFVIIFCTILIYSSMKTKLSIDPGFIHVLVISIAMSSMILLYIFHYSNIDFLSKKTYQWLLWQDNRIWEILFLNMQYVIVLH